MTEIKSRRILEAREYARREEQGNIGYIGALEVAVEDAEAEIEKLTQTARAYSRALAAYRSALLCGEEESDTLREMVPDG